MKRDTFSGENSIESHLLLSFPNRESLFFFKRLHVRLSNNPKIRGKRYSGRKRNNNPSFNQRTLAVFQKNFHIVHVARSSRSISGPRLSGRKACLVHARRRGEEGGSVYVFIQKREDINRPSFQFLCDRILGIGNIRHFSTTRSTRTIPPRFIDLSPL